MNTATTPVPTPRPITMEDVQRIIGAMALELEMLRRENAALRDAIAQVANSNAGRPD